MNNITREFFLIEIFILIEYTTIIREKIGFKIKKMKAHWPSKYAKAVIMPNPNPKRRLK